MSGIEYEVKDFFSLAERGHERSSVSLEWCIYATGAPDSTGRPENPERSIVLIAFA